MLNNQGTTCYQGLEFFKNQMRDLLGNSANIIMQARKNYFCASTPEQQEYIDTLGAYYEGLFLQNENNVQINNFISQVHSEMQIL